MWLVESNKMLKRIRSLVSSCDRKFWEWLEGPSTIKSEPDRNSGSGSDARSKKSSRSMDTERSKVQIPDPWD